MLDDINAEIYEKRIMHEQCHGTFLWLGYGKRLRIGYSIIKINEGPMQINGMREANHVKWKMPLSEQITCILVELVAIDTA